MAVLGTGSLFFWHDLNEGFDSDYEAWHSQEHMPERLRLRGFLRGRRYRNTGLGPKWVIWYEVADPSVLSAPAYMARLDNPTPWTQRIVSEFGKTSRTVCSVAASFGRGVGAFVLALRLSAAEGQEKALEDWLTGIALPELATRPGLSGAHLLIGDLERSQTDNHEKHLRRNPDSYVRRLILVEAYDDVALRAAALSALSSDNLVAHGAAPDSERGIYVLRHALGRDECDN